MNEQLFQVLGPQALVPVIGLAALLWGFRQLIAHARSKSQNRREFLELWKGYEGPDDLWLELAVRHAFGEYLPASVIRMLQRSPQSSRALLEVSRAWPLLDMNDETGEVVWKSSFHADARSRVRVRRLMTFGYFVSMLPAILISFVLLRVDLAGVQHAFWVIPALLGSIAVTWLVESEILEEANKSVPRWLGLS